MKRARLVGRIVVFGTLLCFAPFAHAEPSQPSLLKSPIKIQTERHREAATSQVKNDQLPEETARRLHEYREVLRQEKRLISYNNQVDRMIAAQEEEMASFEQRLRDIEITNSEILPFILKMLARLEQFVSLDLPFLIEKRQARLNVLRQLIDRPDVSVAEKYRHVMEVYQIELAYGRTIEATTVSIDQGGKSHMVHLLRIGRVALFYLTFDGKEAAYWDPEKHHWQTLSGDHRRGIEYGLRIARKEAPPNLLKLPITAPEGVK